VGVRHCDGSPLERVTAVQERAPALAWGRDCTRALAQDTLAGEVEQVYFLCEFASKGHGHARKGCVLSETGDALALLAKNGRGAIAERVLLGGWR
jgi:hypothetical protein